MDMQKVSKIAQSAVRQKDAVYSDSITVRKTEKVEVGPGHKRIVTDEKECSKAAELVGLDIPPMLGKNGKPDATLQVFFDIGLHNAVRTEIRKKTF